MSVASNNFETTAGLTTTSAAFDRQTSATRSARSFQRATWQFALTHRVWLLAVGHAAVFMLSYWLAFQLRFDFQISETFRQRFWITLPALLAIKLYVFYMTGHFHGWWRYVTFWDLIALLRASLLSLLALVLLNHYAMEGQLPRAVVIVDCLVSAILLGSLRASWRVCREFWSRQGAQRIAIMVGADHDNGILAHQIHSHHQLPYRIVGFVDNDERRHGTRLGGMPVLGSLGNVVEIASGCKATDVLVLAGDLHGRTLRHLMDACDQAHLRLKIVPSVIDYLNGSGSIPIRDVEINDLLGREPVRLDMQAISSDVEQKTVLVTGAGGSIGSEICRQLMQFNPQRLVLVDNSENNLFLINHELAELDSGGVLAPYVADVLNKERLRQIFAEERPDFVLHAAAHKHVGLMESNVRQCVRNNVFGTKCIADLAHEFGCAKFVLISTDKAVNPTSVMGASKQIAERYTHAMAQESSTEFIAVRFGNVLGSNGSVVPLFKDQIRRGGPVTVTDQRMTRFFMTIPEATQLVLQAAAMGRGGEIFVLEMGEQVRIADLARDLIRLSGVPADTIEIKYIGIRPGEKLYEELYFDEERSLETSHPKLRAAYHRPYSVAEVLASIHDLEALLDATDAEVREKLMQIVPEFKPAISADFRQPSSSNGTSHGADVEDRQIAS